MREHPVAEIRRIVDILRAHTGPGCIAGLGDLPNGVRTVGCGCCATGWGVAEKHLRRIISDRVKAAWDAWAEAGTE